MGSRRRWPARVVHTCTLASTAGTCGSLARKHQVRPLSLHCTCDCTSHRDSGANTAPGTGRQRQPRLSEQSPPVRSLRRLLGTTHGVAFRLEALANHPQRRQDIFKAASSGCNHAQSPARSLPANVRDDSAPRAAQHLCSSCFSDQEPAAIPAPALCGRRPSAGSGGGACLARAQPAQHLAAGPAGGVGRTMQQRRLACPRALVICQLCLKPAGWHGAAATGYPPLALRHHQRAHHQCTAQLPALSGVAAIRALLVAGVLAGVCRCTSAAVGLARLQRGWVVEACGTCTLCAGAVPPKHTR